MIKIPLIKTCNKTSLFLNHPLLLPLYQWAQGPAPSLMESRGFSACNWFQVFPLVNLYSSSTSLMIYHMCSS